MFHGQERSDQIHPQDFGPIVRRLISERHPAAGNARIRPDHVQPAKFGLRALDIGLHERLVAGVAGHGHRLAAGLGDHLGGLEDGVSLVATDDLGAFASEQQAGGAADAAGCAGNDGRSAFETSHLFPYALTLARAAAAVMASTNTS